ncbi:MAG: hypothetical protein Q7K26_01375 [bacterium]|nr:hypothetical protein [bacterium]
MSKNALIIYRDVGGLHCECGNGEVITDANPTYKKFYFTWSDKGTKGKASGYCRKCNSELQEPQHRNAPLGRKTALLSEFGDPPQ